MHLTKQQTLGIGLGIASAVGTIASIIFSAKNTKKYEQEKTNLAHNATNKEKTWTWMKCYYPTLLVGAATIASEVANNYISAKTITKLAGAGAATSAFLNKYIAESKWQFGDDADKKIRDGMSESVDGAVTLENKDDVFVKVQGMDLLPYSIVKNEKKYRYYDPFTDNWWESTESEVLNAIYHWNRNYAIRGENSIDELYTFLGLNQTIERPDWLWRDYIWSNLDEDCCMEDMEWWVDFGLQERHDKNGELYFELQYSTYPRPPYDEIEESYFDSKLDTKAFEVR